ncbi:MULTISPECIES: flagellar motor switch protein FliN [Arthrobacter]|uniref:Flagellar motor switch protein FliN n=2 Tax=Arthrobacter TaxID=1663 RepID=A0ABU9KMA5_9MICC|nr:flagellar motor switch protein FliN [Arthrobacter sp. YJM1]MDP5226331.1 flagellar motor switch protein FliN [Arthrobacter sp. YJM1]
MSNLALHAAAADRLVASLPVPGLAVTGRVEPGAAAAHAAVSVSATFVGAFTADFALALADAGFVAEAGGGPEARTTAVLRPSFERAAEALQGGVLSELAEGDAWELFSDPDTAVFEISDGGAPFGWFAVRIQDQGMRAGTAPADEASIAGRLGRIHDVEMALTVEIGRTRMSVREALSMEPGKVIELDRSTGAPVDVLLNGRKIALGEVVVVDQDYGVRITRILDVAEAPR